MDFLDWWELAARRRGNPQARTLALLTGFGRGGAFAFDEFGGEAAGLHAVAAEELHHHIHRGHAHA